MKPHSIEQWDCCSIWQMDRPSQRSTTVPSTNSCADCPGTPLWEFGDPITEEESLACEELLQAVIGYAPILGEMSVDGFRGSFLLRKGIVKPGLGFWQLYVEGETYDIVLEQFPWKWGMVKLPWMQWGMEVDWG